MDSLLKTIEALCNQYGKNSQYWIAYSGGLDSQVLLHGFSRVRALHPIKLNAVHIHHGLSPHADKWLQHCKETCRRLKVDFQSHKLQISSTVNLEESARELRYAVFDSLLQANVGILNNILVTGHHQDDQAETLLLQMLRGSGPRGLASMPHIKKLKNGFHARPLLSMTRADLRQYAETYDLQWIEDESNQNTQLTRNFLRSQVIPILKKRWPNVTETLARVTEHCADAQQVLDEFIALELENVRGPVKNTLGVKQLLCYDLPKQKLLLRAWLLEQGFPLPSTIKLQEIISSCLLAREDKNPHVTWWNVEVRRFQGSLYAMHIQPLFNGLQTYEWHLGGDFNIPNLGILKVISQKGEGVFIEGAVTIRFRQGGEKIFLKGHHRALKTLFQEWGVPTWEREKWPLLYSGEHLVAVAGCAISDHFKARDDQIGHQFEFLPSAR